MPRAARGDARLHTNYGATPSSTERFRIYLRVAPLDDLPKLQHASAWGDTGQAFGIGADRERLGRNASKLVERIDIVRYPLGGLGYPSAPALENSLRNNDCAASPPRSIPRLPWSQLAADFDAGTYVAAELHRLTRGVTTRTARSRAAGTVAHHPASGPSTADRGSRLC